MGNSISKEGHHVSTPNRPCAPPRPRRRTQPFQPKKLWRALADEDRNQILNALSRVVADHLTKALLPQEVTHERR
jgi:hypothetical protein